MSIRLSCVIATRNSAPLLPEALRSVTPALGGGAAADVEILVADGGSTDETLAIAARDLRVRVVSRQDSGIYDGMNRALAAAAGDFVIILNSDDVLLADSLGAAIDAIACQADAGWLSAPVLFGQGTQTATARFHVGPLTAEGAIFGIPAINGRIFRRELLERIGPLRTDLGLAADREFMLRMAGSGRTGLAFERAFYLYRVHEGSHTISGDRAGRERVYRAEDQLAQALLADAAIAPETRSLLAASGALARFKLRLTRARVEQGGARGSLRDLATGLRLARRWRGRLSGY